MPKLSQVVKAVHEIHNKLGRIGVALGSDQGNPLILFKYCLEKHAFTALNLHFSTPKNHSKTMVHSQSYGNSDMGNPIS